MEYMKKIFRNRLYFDTRTLALFRIVFGFLGLCDVLRRFSVIDVFYSDAGMNFRRQVTSQYSIKYFTLLDYIHDSIAVHIFFILTAICFVFLILGYKTRLFQLFSAIGLISIHNVAIIVENGADMVFNNYLIWSLFLPLGTSWSIDSVRESLKNTVEYDSNDLNKPKQSVYSRIFHFGYVACLVQLSMIYFYNYINKTGSMWDSGDALFYMYQLDTFLTYIGDWLASALPMDLMKLLSFSTLYIEIAAPVAILSPIFQPFLRRITFITFIIFHFIIGISMNIGMFSWVMMAVLTLLLGKKEIGLAKKILDRYRREYTVFYDRDCGFCHLTARILRRMDGFSRLTWSDKLQKGEKPKNLNTLLETTIVVWDPKTDEIWTRHRGFSRIISALPFGVLFSWILILPGLEKVFGYIYDKIATNRIFVSNILSLPACGLPPEDISSIITKVERPIKEKLNKTGVIFSNILALSLVIGAIDYSMTKNKGFKNMFNTDQKGIKQAVQSNNYKSIRKKMKRVLMYPKMAQNWNMFYSVPQTEKWVLGEITFTNGEKLMLFHNNEDIENTFHHTYFTPYNNQFWRKLFTRLGKSSYQRHIPKFKNWLKNTTYFSAYSGREVADVTLWQLSERSRTPNASLTKQSKVTKKELKKSQRGQRKRKQQSVKKKKNVSPKSKLK